MWFSPTRLNLEVNLCGDSTGLLCCWIFLGVSEASVQTGPCLCFRDGLGQATMDEETDRRGGGEEEEE